jgi:NAD(P)-dependent dehydrogenase (short-subunit alcohol dehydrogenase family)
VLITGGGTGIGAETARYFAQAGATRIAVFGRRAQPLLNTKASIERDHEGVRIFTAPTDVTKKTEV